MPGAVYTPITPVKGGLVHATSLDSPHHTACGIVWRGWRITPHALTCEACKDALEDKERMGKSGKGRKKR